MLEALSYHSLLFFVATLFEIELLFEVMLCDGFNPFNVIVSLCTDT